jgi:hypothetical protein
LHVTRANAFGCNLEEYEVKAAMEITKHFRFAGKASATVLFCICTCAGAIAQSEERKPSSGVEILKLKWEKQARLPRNFDPSVIPTGQVFSSMESRTVIPGSTQAPNGDEARREAASRSAALAPVDIFPNTPARLPFFYVYSLKIQNVGSKTIQAVAWDFVFIHASTKAVLGIHQFLSYAIAKPEHTVTLQARQRTRPIAVVQAANADPKSKPKLLERAIIECVLYDDETMWKNPAGRDGVCDLLKKSKPAATRKPGSKRSGDK